MAITNKRIERRKDRRFQARDKGFVFFNLEPAMAGKIVDISAGGLGLTYLASKRRTGDLLSLRILCIACCLGGTTIPARTIWDFETVRTSLDGSRRAGAQFERLTPHQKHAVNRFIEYCTLDAA
jgi:c-di-GMP-binding flagellar brake protein YcgR